MDASAALNWAPPGNWQKVAVVDSHAGGEPFRVVIGGLPDIPGDTILARRRFAQENLDDLRKLVMWEPRGHADMYGGWIGTPIRPDSDLSVLFVHNEGFSTMCGHGIIALTKVVLDTGILATTGERTTIRIDTPAGQIVSTGISGDGSVDRVLFRNVPSFVDSLDNIIDVPGIGTVSYDLAFGGAYYAYVEAVSVGLRWPRPDQAQLVGIGRLLKKSILERSVISHPEHADLGFLYGVIFTGPPVDPANDLRNVCVFADGEIDRSPTGTGVSGRIAIESARGQMATGDSLKIESIVGSAFTGLLSSEQEYAGRDAIIPEITGTAHITAVSTFLVDPTDPIIPGFLLR